MNETNEMNSKQRRELAQREFHQKYGRFWLLYAALGFTAVLSFLGGLMLPFMRRDIVVPLTWGTAAAAAFYALGFILIGELAANFWFSKVTDQDPDNRGQQITAGIMIVVSVIVSASTALATSYVIAQWLGMFDTILSIPHWAQRYIAIVIPVMMVAHACAAILFKSISDEAYSERDAAAKIQKARNDMAEAKAKAKAAWWEANAPKIAAQMGQIEAADELEALTAKIAEQKAKRQLTMTYASDADRPELEDGKSNGKFRS